MKISVEYDNLQTDTLCKVVNAKHIKNYMLDIQFSNGKKNKVNFRNFLKKSQHPSIRKYLDIDKFNNFEIKNGNVNWNNYDLIFPIEDLLAQKI
ncbi:MAG: DUF2442 domain-containing protein [Prevotellaceae bacterium]|jgi:hypothetical protein|nr:DUF2442 domain-containing protein [Prevotellaceae bacterium]